MNFSVQVSSVNLGKQEDGLSIVFFVKRCTKMASFQSIGFQDLSPKYG